MLMGVPYDKIIETTIDDYVDRRKLYAVGN